jgi:hypothetical protein
MPLKVVWFSRSVGKPADRSPSEFAAYHFLLSLGGGRVAGETLVPVGSDQRRLTQSNVDDALECYGEMVAGYFRQKSIVSPLLLVPIPNPEITLESSLPPRSSLLAMAIASKVDGDVDVADILRWKRKLPESASVNGSGGPAKLYSNLVVTRKLERVRPAILVGYLARSTARLQACAAAVEACGAEVKVAVFAGRVVPRPSKEPFAVMGAEVPSFNPACLSSA